MTGKTHAPFSPFPTPHCVSLAEIVKCARTQGFSGRGQPLEMNISRYI